MTTSKLRQNMNKDDQSVPDAVNAVIPQIESLVKLIVTKIKSGGRLFYMGAGTSGRLGVLDASECPPTFGVSPNVIIGIIAGGDVALRKSIENAEDSTEQGWNDLQKFNISDKDVVVGIAASGTTPYVISALEKCNINNIITGCITMNEGSPLALTAQHPIACVVGPEFLTGSSRMKAGTAQKLILNMISTSVMILLGKVKGNKMVDMQLSNDKLVDRGARMVMEALNIDKTEALHLLKKHGSIRDAINSLNEQ